MADNIFHPPQKPLTFQSLGNHPFFLSCPQEQRFNVRFLTFPSQTGSIFSGLLHSETSLSPAPSKQAQYYLQPRHTICGKPKVTPQDMIRCIRKGSDPVAESVFRVPLVSWEFLHRFRWGCTSDMEKAMAPHSSTLAWKIPWTEEPGRLQSMRSHSVGHD